VLEQVGGVGGLAGDAPRARRGCRRWPRAVRRRWSSVRTGARGTRVRSWRSERARRQRWRAGWAGARGLGGEVGVCQRRLCRVRARCGRACVRPGGGVGVGHGRVVGAGGRAWAVRGGLCGCVSACKPWVGGGTGWCGWVRGGLGGDAGGWKGRLGGVGGLCGRAREGLGEGVGVGKRHVGGAGGRAGRVRGGAAGFSRWLTARRRRWQSGWAGARGLGVRDGVLEWWLCGIGGRCRRVRAVFTGLSALAKVDFAALVVAVLWCAWGSGAVPPIGTGGFEALVGGVTGCTGGWAGVSALGTAWSSVLGAVLGRWSGD